MTITESFFIEKTAFEICNSQFISIYSLQKLRQDTSLEISSANDE